MRIVIVTMVLLLSVMAYIRMSPNAPGQWHQPIAGDRDETFKSGAIRIVPAKAEDFARLHEIALGWARTRVLAGSVAEGRITYITRTAFWGFPDFTTIEQRDGRIALFARLRFGGSDLGVNGKRIDAWLDALAQG